MRNDTAETVLASLDKQLQHIARQVRDLADHPRAEYADLLQEARIGAFQAWQRAQQKPRRNPRQYILAGARSQAEQYLWRQQRTHLYSAEKLPVHT